MLTERVMVEITWSVNSTKVVLRLQVVVVQLVHAREARHSHCAFDVIDDCRWHDTLGFVPIVGTIRRVLS